MLGKDLGQWPWSKILGQDVGPRCCSRSWSVTLTKNADQWPWSKTPKALVQGVGPKCCSTSWSLALITNASHWSRPKMAKALVQEEMLDKDFGQKIGPGCWSKMVMKNLGLAKAGLVAWPWSKGLIKDTGERFLPKDDLGPRPQPKIWNQDFPQRCWSKMLGKGLGQWPWSKILGQNVCPRCCSRSWSVTLTKNADQWPWSQTPKSKVLFNILISGLDHKCKPLIQAKDDQGLGPRGDVGQRFWPKVLVQDVDQRWWWKTLAWPKLVLLHGLVPRG